MSLSPFQEKGISIDRQFRNWAELNVTSYDKDDVHPYTRARVTEMKRCAARE